MKRLMEKIIGCWNDHYVKWQISRILTVDDIEDKSDTLQRTLTRVYNNITLADCVAEAPDLSQTKHFDLILLDLTMSNISGLEVLKK